MSRLNVMKMWRYSSRNIGISLVIAAILVVVAGVAFGAKRRAVTPPGVGPQAAHVNGVAIYKGDVDAKAAMIASNLNAPVSIEDVRSSVLQNMVKQEILYQTAPRYGIGISDADVTAAIRATVQNIVSPEMDETSRQESLGYIQRMGLTLEQYPTDSRVIKSWRRTYMIDKMRQWVMDRVPLEQRTSAQALESAVDDFIEQQHAVVTYP